MWTKRSSYQRGNGNLLLEKLNLTSETTLHRSRDCPTRWWSRRGLRGRIRWRCWRRRGGRWGRGRCGRRGRTRPASRWTWSIFQNANKNAHPNLKQILYLPTLIPIMNLWIKIITRHYNRATNGWTGHSTGCPFCSCTWSGWLWCGVFHHTAHLPSHICQIPISQGGIWQTVYLIHQIKF